MFRVKITKLGSCQLTFDPIETLFVSLYIVFRNNEPQTECKAKVEIVD